MSKDYVSRAGQKQAGATPVLKLDFRGKTVLDVGSSTGGFSDYALRQGAAKVVAVELGTGQMHPAVRADPRLELHEKTDIRGFKMVVKPDIVVADLSFVSLRQVLPSISALSKGDTQIVVLLKPQFEASDDQLNRGIVKNERLRRQILKDFEAWARGYFQLLAKADSDLAGAHGNRERFYLLRKLAKDKLPSRADPAT